MKENTAFPSNIPGVLEPARCVIAHVAKPNRRTRAGLGDHQMDGLSGATVGERVYQRGQVSLNRSGGAGMEGWISGYEGLRVEVVADVWKRRVSEARRPEARRAGERGIY